MAQAPTTTDPALWHRFFAMQGNNRAWDLVEQSRVHAANHDLLDAAHAAAWHWRAIGTELNHMRATMLLAEVHALLGHGQTALAYAEAMKAYFLGKSDTPDWEIAFTHAIHAHAAHAAGRGELHAAAYRDAAASIAVVKDDEDRAVVLKTFALVPAP